MGPLHGSRRIFLLGPLSGPEIHAPNLHVIYIKFAINYKVKIVAVNDERPSIIRNDVLRVEVGESRILSNHALHAVDLDSTDSELLYHLTKMPTKGELIIKQFGKEDHILRAGEYFSEEQGKEHLFARIISTRTVRGVRTHNSIRNLN